MENSKKEPKYKDTLVPLPARVPPALKDLVHDFGKDSQRSASQAVHYLLSTHPEIQKMKEEQNADLIS